MALQASTVVRTVRRVAFGSSRAGFITFIVAFGVIGSVFLLVSHAATPSTTVQVSLQPGNGVTLSGGAQNVSDPLALNQEAVEFGGEAGGTAATSGCTVNNTVAPCMNGSGAGTGTSGYGTPVFDDEFDGTSLNTGNWVASRRDGSFGAYNPPSNGGDEIETFSAKAVTVSNGNLALTATQNGSSWTSGTIEAQSNKNFTYGYFEARIKVPDPANAWTAWWLTGADSWPPEIDIFEFHFCNNQPTFNNHGNTSGTNTNLPGWPCSTAYGGSSTDFTQWHTYGVLWTSSSIKLYFDGVLQSITTYSSSDPAPTKAMYPIIDYAIEQGHNPPSGSQLLADYVRIWCPGGGTSCASGN